jgi:hypothetical protein
MFRHYDSEGRVSDAATLTDRARYNGDRVCSGAPGW